MSIYRGKIVNKHPMKNRAYVVVPQTTGTVAQTAQIPEGVVPVPGDEAWVAYEGGDLTRPVVLQTGLADAAAVRETVLLLARIVELQSQQIEDLIDDISRLSLGPYYASDEVGESTHRD